MPRIQPLDPATATGDTAAHLATARKMFGGTPNLVTTAANAPAALNAMLGLFARNDLEVLENCSGRFALMGFHHGDDNVTSLVAKSRSFFQHRVGLADAGSGAEQHSEPPSLHRNQPFIFARATFSSSTLTLDWPRYPRSGAWI